MISSPREGRGQVRARLGNDRADPAAGLLFPLAILTLAVAMLLGGAGVDYPLLTGIIEALSIALLWGCLKQPTEDSRRPDWLLRATIAAILLIPLLQLVPLPQGWWTALPGRSDAVAVLSAAGLPLGMRPLSLTPEATLESGLALLPGLAILAAVLRLDATRRAKLLWVVLAAALLSALLGALQKATAGDAMLVPFPSGHSANGPGLFVNRNHQAAFLLACMPLAAGSGRLTQSGQGSRTKLLSLAVMMVLMGGAAATTSRMGIVILPISLLLSLLILFEPRISLKSLGLAVLLFVGIVSLALQSSGVQATLARFTGTDIRYQYWQDTWFGARHFWPIGAGIGSFSTLFPRFESLSSINETYVFNAHNDYLELLFEAGLAAVAALLLFLLLLAKRAHAALKPSTPLNRKIPALAGLSAIIILMLHSITDYPLRMLSCLTLFGFAVGLLVAETGTARGKGTGERP